MNKPEIKISIRNLVELVLRAGDLDNRLVSSTRMLDGTKVHQRLQKEGGEQYSKEVFMSFEYEKDEFIFKLEGRADGIISEPEAIVIDEIKSTTRPIESIDEDFSLLHWAQAKCYAFIYVAQNQLQSVCVQLTYFQLNTEEIKRIRNQYSFHELQVFMEELLDKYNIWARMSEKWTNIRNTSINQLQFPFESYRKGQRELAVAVYKTIMQEKKLFVQAPTGIGKTISTLFPSVKAIGEGHISKIFYLTAKTITRQVAEEAFLKMRKCGLRLRTITLTAKEKICFNKEGSCNPDFCQYAKGHFNRINAALIDILESRDDLTRDIIEEYAQKHMVCPFEFSLDLSIWADSIVCDYNYAFDPRVYLKRFFLNNDGDYAFLVDEAHNLVDRAREMFSAELNKTDFLEAKKLMKNKQPVISRILNKINSYMVTLRKECSDDGFLVKKDQLKDLHRLLNLFIAMSEEWILSNQNSNVDGYDQILQLFFDSVAFLKISEFYDERYVTFIETNNNRLRVKLFCIDPSYLLSEALKRGKTAVFFSATLTPLSYFMEILGGDKTDYNINLNSPFDNNNLCLLVEDNISTRYKNRENSYDKIADIIRTSIEKRHGNYVVYFPSYKYMNEVYTRFVEKYPEIETMVQQPGMTEEEKESFLNSFIPDRRDNFVCFGVLGGIFSEGIDLKGDRLIGAVIVSVGLPQISTEQNIIMNYYNNKNGMGFENAYIFPGMNKVLQAAGRVIRSENDKGMVLLLDERFSHVNYKSLFPKHWEHSIRVKNKNDLGEKLDKFWSKVAKH